MKNNPVALILVGLFLLGALETAWLGQKYNSAYNREQAAEMLVARMRYTQFVANQLLADTAEYSKKNPAILPLIQVATNPGAPPSAAAVKPPAK